MPHDALPARSSCGWRGCRPAAADSHAEGEVTYNFDPEKWYAIRRAALEQRRIAGELDAAAFDRALAELDPPRGAARRQDAGFAVPGGDADR